MEISVVHLKEENAFKAYNSGVEIGHLTYLVSGDEMNINHTFVEPAFRGQGVASRLVDAATEYGRQMGWVVVASCSYANGRIIREYR